MNVIRTESPGPLRAVAWVAAWLRRQYLLAHLKAARADAIAYASQSKDAQLRAELAERLAIRIQQRIDGVA